MNKEEILRLADFLECNDASLERQSEAAAELRRLVAENEKFRKHIKSQNEELDKLIPMAERLEAENETLDKRLEEAIEDMKTILSQRMRLRCKHHGPAKPDEWACPSCLRELRAEAESLRAENEALRADAERLDWLQQAADARKVELARSILKTGYEIGEWPSMRVTVARGSLRNAIDEASNGS